MKQIPGVLALLALASLACSVSGLLAAPPTAAPAPTSAATMAETIPSSTPLATTVSTSDSPTPQPPIVKKKCGDGVCDGPENAANCPADCAAETTRQTVSPTLSSSGEYQVTNPANSATLNVHVILPDESFNHPYPAVVLVPGGSGSGASFLKPNAEAAAFSREGYAVVVFDPDGRGKSTGAEDYNGAAQQDGLAAVIRFAAGLPQVDATRIALVSYSYGITMAAGALARHPDLPVLFLVDWEGPADRNDTGGCDGARLGHLKEIASCSDESFWAEREASAFIGKIRAPYQRIQSQIDHVQPDNSHAVLMINNAVNGGVPWVRLNMLPPNQTFDAANPPDMLSEEEARLLNRLVLQYLKSMFDLHARP